jgi:hypothetical protein
MSKTALLTTASFIAFSAVAQAGVPQEDVWSKNDLAIIKHTPLEKGTEETGKIPNFSGSTETSTPSAKLPWNMSDEVTYNKVLEALMEGVAYGAYYGLGGSNLAYMATRTTFTFFGYEPGIHEELYKPLLDPLRETANEYAARIANTGRFMMTEGVSLLPYWTA